MGFKNVKYLEGVQRNRILFYLDGIGAEDPTSPNYQGIQDLPPITDKTSIVPGSEARVLTTGDKYILNTNLQWQLIPPPPSSGGGSGGGGISDVPSVPQGETYSRRAGGSWVRAISHDAGNQAIKGSDGGVFVPETDSAAISNDPGNIIIRSATDNGLYAPAPVIPDLDDVYFFGFNPNRTAVQLELLGNKVGKYHVYTDKTTQNSAGTFDGDKTVYSFASSEGITQFALRNVSTGQTVKYFEVPKDPPQVGWGDRV